MNNVNRKLIELKDLNNELPTLKGESGLYCWLRKSTNEYLYVGRSKDLAKRMKAYLDYCPVDITEGSYVNAELGWELSNNPDDIVVDILIYEYITKNNLNLVEKYYITKLLPLFNLDGNPLHENTGIQFAMCVVASHNPAVEWTFESLTNYMNKAVFNERIALERIHEALKDEQNNLAKQQWNGYQLVRTRHRKLKDKKYFVKKIA